MNSRPMLEIPVSTAEEVAERYGYDQVVIIARRVGDEPEPHGEHVTTYGRDKAHCGMAARVGNYIKHKIMGWPEYEPAAPEMPAVDALHGVRRYHFVQQSKFGPWTEVEQKVAGSVAFVKEADFAAQGAGVPAPVPAAPAPVVLPEPVSTYIEVLECSDCGHIGINDADGSKAACNTCEWQGDSPIEDKCPGCNAVGTMTSACPKCGARTSLIAETNLLAGVSAPAAQAGPVSDEPPFLQRLRVEHSKLHERQEKLDAFLRTPAFRMLEGDDQGLLQKQENLQHALLQTLNQRIHSAVGKHSRSKKHG